MLSPYIIRVTDKVAEKLEVEQKTRTYWALLDFCDKTTLEWDLPGEDVERDVAMIIEALKVKGYLVEE